ncbi:MAG: thymidine kinase [Actinomycetota bacterium]
MAKLRFFFGTMGSGKSTQALQIRHNLAAGGLDVILTTQLDRQVGRVSSRLGVAAEAEVVDHRLDLFQLAAGARRADALDAMVCDEAQFYEPGQIDQLARVVDELGVDVYAFGLLTSFQGDLFPGTKRLLELADERNELQVEARCWCGERATHNARLVDGVQVYAGELKVVGDTEAGSGEEPPQVTYELLCRAHWHEGLRTEQGHQLELIDDRPVSAPDAAPEIAVGGTVGSDG